MEVLKVLYVYHDCFVVKTDVATLVFDFWKDPYQKEDLPNPLINSRKDLPVYVFVSHGHKDHYNPDIFKWSQFFPDIKYVVSKDVRKRINHIISAVSPYKGVKVRPDRIITMSDSESFEDNVLKIKSFPSTDIGNSYAIEIAGKCIFHSGDLNAWIWKDESSEEEVGVALGDYEKILNMIASSFSYFDICFFPVDSRIGTDYFTGAKMFLERIDVGTFFPMHFELGENPGEIARLHRDAAAFERYCSSSCHRYVMSAPYSAYAIIE